MLARFYTLLVVSLWLVAMSWLMLAKVLPALRGGQPPDAQRVLPKIGERPLVEAWRISWSDEEFKGDASDGDKPGPNGSAGLPRRIGWMVSRSTRREDLSADVRTLVHFDRFPLTEILGEFLGPLARLAGPLAGTSGRLELDLASQAQLDLDGRLERFFTTVDCDGFSGLAHIEGTVTEPGKLDLTVSTRTEDSAEGQMRYREVFRKVIDLPRDAVISDSFSPQSRLAGLRPGQSWTFPVYRAFPPNSPVQIIEAKAEYFELIYWDGQPVETMRVVFQNDSGSALGVAQEPLARLWVRSDGTVLVQELKVGNRSVRFERYAEDRLPAAVKGVLSRW